MSNADEGPVQSLMDLTGCDAREAASALERCNANVSEAAELLFRDLEDLESEIAAIDRYVDAIGKPLGGAASSGPGTEALSSAGLVALTAARREAEAAAAAQQAAAEAV
jgi:predicted RNase H-like HicB family nuclease